MNRLKLANPAWAGYTGTIGTVDFVNGVSAYPVPRQIADRISAAIRMIEVDEDGNEVKAAGVANRLIADAAMRAPVPAALKVQSEDERKAEDLDDTLKNNKAPTDKFYTHEELQAIADEKGIKGLREVAAPWNVKNKAIPGLIEAILGAQNSFTNGKTDIIREIITGEKPEPEPEEEKLAKNAPSEIQEAAITGDLSAALNVEDVSAETLLGSNTFASTYEIEGQTVTLGDLVAEAFKVSGASIEEWNALEEGDRDDLIRLELDRRLPKE